MDTIIDISTYWMLLVTLGTRIQELRLKRGWKTRKDADRATDGNVPEDTWKNIETKGTDPRLSTLQKMQEALGVSIHELLDGVSGPGPTDTKPRRRRAKLTD